MEIDRYWEGGGERLCVSYGIYARMAAVMRDSADLCVSAGDYGLLMAFMRFWRSLCGFKGGARSFFYINRSVNRAGMVLTI